MFLPRFRRLLGAHVTSIQLEIAGKDRAKGTGPRVRASSGQAFDEGPGLGGVVAVKALGQDDCGNGLASLDEGDQPGFPFRAAQAFERRLLAVARLRDPVVRRGISTFCNLANVAEVESGI